MRGKTILYLKGISKTFGSTIALRNIEIELYQGEIRGLVGENGSGKSTLASIIAGIIKPDEGEMFFKGELYSPNNMIDAQNHGVGIIVQEVGTISNLTIAENMFLGKESCFERKGFINKKFMNKEAERILNGLGISNITPDLPISHLDMQDRKLIEIAKVFTGNIELLILDETTTSLSFKGREILYKIIKNLKKSEKTILFISHDIEELMDICDRITVLRDGEIISTIERAEFNESKIKQLMVGREIIKDFYRSDSEDQYYNDEIVLKAENITTLSGLKNISLELHKGEILGIGGLSHCGMHQLGKALFGVEPLLRGRVIHVKSGNLINSPLSAIRNGIGYVPKDRNIEGLVLNASVKENIVSAGLDMIKINKILISPKKEKNYVMHLIDELKIKCSSIYQSVQELSGGNRQKVVFSKWLGRNCEILILDCPTRGVDVGVKASMYQLIYNMKRQGRSIIMISEELPELIGMSDRILILKNGSLSAEFKRSSDLTENKIIEYMI